MLSENTRKIIKETTPAVAQLGTKLTAHFYERMFKNHDELRNIFNMSHQEQGSQREALFNAIAAYAVNIDNPTVLTPAIMKIAHKHCALGIVPAQYDIVGENLLGAITELLNPPAEVLNAWGEAYGFLKGVFIEVEEGLYKANESAPGGWRGTREFVVKSKENKSSNIVELTFESADGKSAMAHKPGQYLSIYLNDEKLGKYQQIRQYSIVDHLENGYKIAVKKDCKVSTFIHEHLNVGDKVKLSSPFGDFYFEDHGADTVLISGGVGITPMMSMAKTLVEGNVAKKVSFLHVSHNEDVLPFAKEVSDLAAKCPNFKATTWLSQETKDGFKHGHINLDEVPEVLTEGAHYYMCGPVGFMQDIAKQLQAKGVAVSNIHYECFGPHKVVG